jgi:shikimate dehydrogenase
MSLNGEYRLYPVPPLPDGAARLAALFDRLRLGEIDGLNVTIPHKQAVLAYLDGLTTSAESIGAVNAVFYQDGHLLGDNTDAPGFLSDLAHVLPADVRPRRALVLGAGGAARAVVYALLSTGWQVSVAARRIEQAMALANSLQIATDEPLRASPALLAAATIRPLLPEIGLIVNASSAGMLPDVDSNPWPSSLPFPPQAFVYDLVYKPAETSLLRQARLAAVPAANGLGMLIEQAALSLERWSGQSVPRQAMWQVVQS